VSTVLADGLGSRLVSESAVAAKLCQIEGCSKPAKNGRGRYCSAHMERRRLYGDPLGRAPETRPWRGRPCMVPGCDRPNRALGLCKLHVQRAYAHGGDPLGGRWLPAIPPGAEGEPPLEADRNGWSEPIAPEVGPLHELRRELRELRAGHVPFEAAWPLALALVGPDLDPWHEALVFALPEWRAAYCGEPPVLSFGVPDPWASSVALAEVVDALVDSYA
jgi:hypothetical protein